MRKREPSRRGWYDWVRSACDDQDDYSIGGKDQTVPYGTDSLLNAFQAINCLATIIASLRDGRFLPSFQLSGLTTITPSLRGKIRTSPAALRISFDSSLPFPSEWSRLWHGFSYDSCTLYGGSFPRYSSHSRSTSQQSGVSADLAGVC